MSLLDCICCCRHHLRTAVCWNSPDEPSAFRFLTYSCLFERADAVCTTLRSFSSTQSMTDSRLSDSDIIDWQPSRSPVAIYGRSCPEVVCALLGVMSLPAPYMPLDLSRPVASRWSTMQECGVRIVLIEFSLFSDFLSKCNLQALKCRIRFDGRLLQQGLVICYIQWRHQIQSHDSHVTQDFAMGHVLDEFHAALEHYHCEINTKCWLCRSEYTDSPITREKPKSLDMTNSDNSTTSLLNSPIYSSDSAAKEKFDTSNLINLNSPSNYSSHPFPSESLHSGSIAYLLHTTGTTGQPKPVRAPHCCVVPNVVDLRGRFAMSPDDVVFNAAPLTFDPSVIEIFLALSSGACLLIVPTKVKRSPLSLSRVLFQRQFVTVLQVTPALLWQLPETVITSRLLGPESCVRVLALGGEACPSLSTLAQWKSPENKTAIFNIYGITEVSSWAACYRVTDEDLASGGCANSPTGVPLGGPLLGTCIELRDEDGTPVERGNGFIWIGGLYRSCLVGDESELTPSVMRPSGDLGHIDQNGKLFYDGRCDRQIKRLGHRINLDHIQQTIEGLEIVALCRVLSLSHHNLSRSDYRLVAFLVLVESTSTKSEVEANKSFLFAKMKEVLPNYCIPDQIEILTQLPINEHGKVDTRELYQFCDSLSQRESPPEIDQISLTVESAGVLLQSCAQRVLGLGVWSDHQNILELGVSSFDVVRLANHVEDELKQFINPSSDKTFDMTKLVEYLLEKPLVRIADYVCSVVVCDEPSMDGSRRSAQKRAHGLSDELVPKKLLKMEPEMDSFGYREIRSFRRGQTFINGRQQHKILHHSTDSVPSPNQLIILPAFELVQKWRVDTGKCVDASPLLIQDDFRDPPEIVYIGSHSGRFFAICFRTGRVLWETQLTDRIESSACLSVCGLFVIVGCYDGCVYSLASDSGATHWCTKPGGSSEPIKSSPCVDPITGLVWVGSHDHHIYALDIYAKEVVHCVYPGGGSCFSSPCVDSDRRLLYCATLQGIIAALNLDSGGMLWTYKCPKPVFSSPALLPSSDCIVIGCVDGGVYVIASNGQHVATLSTDGAVFSSCCVTQDSDSGTRIYCGSHDRHVYCWNEKLKLEWKSEEFDSEIYSIPCVSEIRFQTEQGTCQKPVLFASTTSGCIHILNPDSGLELGKLSLPWDVFSSPVIFDNCLAVGCRDDYVYCYNIIINCRQN